jgi:hypothetical protein
MAIKITDNFQVNIKNPIDNRFVVGSQSIPGVIGTVYPTPFYAYRDDISSNIGFVYPGLRIWDFNENLPYVWTGTTWSNENLTGASVEGSGNPGGTGFENYVVKFKNNATVLTKSLLFDNYEHVGLGIITGINPNSSSGIPLQASLNLPASGLTQGLHVQGHIKTNSGFIGDGKYIGNINAGNINAGPGGTGRLALEYINTGGLITASTNPYNPYLLTTNGSNLTTSWQSLLSIIPHWEPTTLGLGNSGAVSLYSGENGSNQYEFFSLVSTGLDITDGTTGAGSVRIESKAGQNLGGGSASVYKQLNPITKVHEFKTLNSDFMNITETSDVINLNSNISSSSLQVTSTGAHGIKIEIPASFEGTDYYVNNNYPLESAPGIPNVELGTRSKPFRSLKRCINKILNRVSGNDAGGILGHANASPSTKDPALVGPVAGVGQEYQKWELRSGSTPNVRVIIQTYTEINENLAINRVTYFLENAASSYINVPSGILPHNIDPLAAGLEYLFDMVPLVAGAPRTNGRLDYAIYCNLEGSGSIGFYGNSYDNNIPGGGGTGGHPGRKGFFRAKGTNSLDYYISLGYAQGNPLNLGDLSEQNDCSLNIGSVGGFINCYMERLPNGGNTTNPTISYTDLLQDDTTTYLNGLPRFREGMRISGYKTTVVPDYGAIQVEGRNAMFFESLFINGTFQLNCVEQHMIYAKDYGTIYADSGRIYMRRNYQKVNYSTIADVVRNPSLITGASFVAGQRYKIKTLGSGNWNSIAQSGSWTDGFGNPQTGPALNRCFTSNGIALTGSGSPAAQGTFRTYLPSNHIYDIYLKDGATLNYGGDFYTQQNTGASDGGPDAFIFLENTVNISGDLTHPGSSLCGLNISGGGFVTGMIYNYYIKSVIHNSYPSWNQHGINLKGLKLESNVYKNVISVTPYLFPNTPWPNHMNFGTFKNCFLYDFLLGSDSIRVPFTNNIVVYNGTNTGTMRIYGSTIDLAKGFINTSIPAYTSVALANADLPAGAIYKVTTDNGILRVAGA